MYRMKKIRIKVSELENYIPMEHPEWVFPETINSNTTV